MAADPRYNFFALLKTDVRRLVTEQPLQNELSKEFVRQRDELLADSTEIAFDPRYKVEDDEIFIINGFPLPEEIGRALQNPIAAPPLDRDSVEQWDALNSIYGGNWNKGNPEIVFQTFDRRRSLARNKWSLIMRGDAFARLDDPGLVLDTRAAAVFRDKKLYFRSYAEARRIFDLAAYYREATEADVEAFTRVAGLEFESAEAFIGAADATVRRRIAFINDSNVLKCTPKQIASAAKKYDLDIPLRNGKVFVPRDKKEMKMVLRFLEENYYTSDLTKTKYVSSAKRPIGRP